MPHKYRQIAKTLDEIEKELEALKAEMLLQQPHTEVLHK